MLTAKDEDSLDYQTELGSPLHVEKHIYIGWLEAGEGSQIFNAVLQGAEMRFHELPHNPWLLADIC